MKEVALYDAKNSLSALIQEVEESGAEIMITRHGKPAARLSPASPEPAQTRRQATERLIALRKETHRRHPETGPVTWADLKRLMRDEVEGE